MKGSVLFLGNGINQLSDCGINWNGLLSKLADGRIDDDIIGSDIPATIKFEIISNKLISGYDMNKSDNENCKINEVSNKIYSAIKEKIIKILKHSFNESGEDKINEISKTLSEFINLGFKMIITTNYDMNIEHSIDSKINIEDYKTVKYNRKIGFSGFDNAKVNSIKYVTHQCFNLNDIDVFHIHGDIFNKRSICMGYEHYAGIIEHLRTEIERIEDNKTDCRIIQYLKYNDLFEYYHWAYSFFENDIYIVGFGLDDVELDIWWLITYRAYLMTIESKIGKERLINNKIYYYDSYLDETKKKKLESLDVIYTSYFDNKEECDFSKAYKNTYEDIKEKINKRKL